MVIAIPTTSQAIPTINQVIPIANQAIPKGAASYRLTLVQQLQVRAQQEVPLQFHMTIMMVQASQITLKVIQAASKTIQITSKLNRVISSNRQAISITNQVISMEVVLSQLTQVPKLEVHL